MKKLIITITFLFSNLIISSNSYAEWVYIYESDSAKTYIDSDRIIFKNDQIYYWALRDWFSEDGYGYLSSVSQTVTECDLKRFMNLQITNYKNAMGKGIIVGYDKSDTQWRYALPGSNIEMEINVICEIRK